MLVVLLECRRGWGLSTDLDSAVSSLYHMCSAVINQREPNITTLCVRLQAEVVNEKAIGTLRCTPKIHFNTNKYSIITLLNS